MEENERAAEKAAREIIESTPSIVATETVLPPTPEKGNDVEMSSSTSGINKETEPAKDNVESAEDDIESAEDDVESASAIAALASLSVESSPASPVSIEAPLPPAVAGGSPDFFGSGNVTGGALASVSIPGGMHTSMYTRHSMHDLC